MRPYRKSQLMKIPSLLLLATVALAPLSAVANELLVKFDGGIGAIPVSQGEGTAATATVVDRNNVRGVQAPGQPWAIADFKAEVMVDGRIRADGRGLVFAGGNTIGTALVVTPTGGTAGLKVFATLICENVPTFVQRNTNLAGVPLAANGDLRHAVASSSAAVLLRYTRAADPQYGGQPDLVPGGHPEVRRISASAPVAIVARKSVAHFASDR
jgi:hypothetical protein